MRRLLRLKRNYEEVWLTKDGEILVVESLLINKAQMRRIGSQRLGYLETKYPFHKTEAR